MAKSLKFVPSVSLVFKDLTTLIKKKKKFLIYKEIQKGAVAMSYSI
jgi:hypothetical protein